MLCSGIMFRDCVWPWLYWQTFMYYYVYIVDHVYVVNYSFYDVIYDVIIYISMCACTV